MVVDCLEVVEVSHEHAERLACALAACVLALQHLVESAAVGKAGESVGQAQAFQLFVGRLQRLCLSPHLLVVPSQQPGHASVVPQAQTQHQHQCRNAKAGQLPQLALAALLYIALYELTLTFLMLGHG